MKNVYATSLRIGGMLCLGALCLSGQAARADDAWMTVRRGARPSPVLAASPAVKTGPASDVVLAAFESAAEDEPQGAGAGASSPSSGGEQAGGASTPSSAAPGTGVAQSAAQPAPPAPPAETPAPAAGTESTTPQATGQTGAGASSPAPAAEAAPSGPGNGSSTTPGAETPGASSAPASSGAASSPSGQTGAPASPPGAQPVPARPATSGGASGAATDAPAAPPPSAASSGTTNPPAAASSPAPSGASQKPGKRPLRESAPPTGRNALGITVGMSSGVGLSYRRFVTDLVALQLTGIVFANDKGAAVSIGLSGQEDFVRTTMYRAYAVQSMAFHKVGTAALLAPGAGIGVEYDFKGITRGFAVRGELVLTAVVDVSSGGGLFLFTPLPQIGALYVF